MKRKYIRGSAREAKSISHEKKEKELNMVFANHIKDIVTKEKVTYCPNCKTKLEKAENTYMGIPVLSRIYCPRCSFTPENEE